MRIDNRPSREQEDKNNVPLEFIFSIKSLVEASPFL
jgi:hypothetical protein